jgi:hypothetical protein
VQHVLERGTVKKNISDALNAFCTQSFVELAAVENQIEQHARLSSRNTVDQVDGCLDCPAALTRVGPCDQQHGWHLGKTTPYARQIRGSHGIPGHRSGPRTLLHQGNVARGAGARECRRQSLCRAAGPAVSSVRMTRTMSDIRAGPGNGDVIGRAKRPEPCTVRATFRIRRRTKN